MKFVNRVLGLGLLLAPQLALGGNGGAIVHAPFASAVPGIGGLGLVTLGVLLGVLAARLIRRPQGSGSKLMISAFAVAALASGASGVKLIGDAKAGMTMLAMVLSGGGTVELPDENDCFQVFNDTTVTQQIIDVQGYPPAILTACTNGGVSNGGVYRGTCSESPSTVLNVGDFCDIQVNLPVPP
ncbi:MAG: midcut-by-XrtH protein [Chromatiales bacterium]|nr:midcut-by-XrtH protein [Chromatiales bacterium]